MFQFHQYVIRYMLDCHFKLSKFWLQICNQQSQKPLIFGDGRILCKALGIINMFVKNRFFTHSKSYKQPLTDDLAQKYFENMETTGSTSVSRKSTVIINFPRNHFCCIQMRRKKVGDWPSDLSLELKGFNWNYKYKRSISLDLLVDFIFCLIRKHSLKINRCSIRAAKKHDLKKNF